METISNWTFVPVKVDSIPVGDTCVARHLASHPTISAIMAANEVACHGPLCLDGRLVASKQHLYVSVMQAFPGYASGHDTEPEAAALAQSIPTLVRKPTAGADGKSTTTPFPQPSKVPRPMKAITLRKRAPSQSGNSPTATRAQSPTALKPQASVQQTSHSTQNNPSGGLLDAIYNGGRMTPKQRLLSDLKLRQEHLKCLQMSNDNANSATAAALLPRNKRARAEIFLSPVSIYSTQVPQTSPLAAAVAVCEAVDKHHHTKQKTPKLVASAAIVPAPAPFGTSTSPFLLPCATTSSAPMGFTRHPAGSVVPSMFSLPPPLPSPSVSFARSEMAEQTELVEHTNKVTDPIESHAAEAEKLLRSMMAVSDGVEFSAEACPLSIWARVTKEMGGTDTNRTPAPEEETDNIVAMQANGGNHTEEEGVMVIPVGSSPTAALPTSAARSESFGTDTSSSVGPTGKSHSNSSVGHANSDANTNSFQSSPTDDQRHPRKASKPQKRFRHSKSLFPSPSTADGPSAVTMAQVEQSMILIFAFYNLTLAARTEVHHAIATRIQEGALKCAMDALGRKRCRADADDASSSEDRAEVEGSCCIVSLADLSELRCGRRISEAFGLSPAEEGDVEGAVVSRVAIASL